MNIGIVGLLPEQVRFVQQEFPGHALKFLSKDNESEMGNFAKGCDKVVLMTKFIGHHIQDRVQPSKRILLTGGVTKLKATLSKLPSPVKLTTPTPQAKPAPIAAASEVDWSPLDTAKLGDEVRIARPASVSLKAFDMRVIAGRSYRKKTRGIVTTPHRMVDGFAVMTIREMRTCTDGPAAIEQATPTPTSEETTMQLEHLQTGMPVVQGVAPVSLADSRAAAFWQSVFLETVKQWPGAPVDLCASRADEAVAAYRKRIGHIAMQ
jgi:hypothetical protein